MVPDGMAPTIGRRIAFVCLAASQPSRCLLAARLSAACAFSTDQEPP